MVRPKVSYWPDAKRRHCNRSNLILEAVARLILNRWPGRFLLESLVESATLDHESRDNTVEYGAGVVPILHIA